MRLLFAAIMAGPALAAEPRKPPGVTNGTVVGDLGKALDARFAGHAEKDFTGTVLVAVGGKVVLAKGYGFADRAEKVQFTTDTAFDVGSITKPFTAAAILTLEAAGKLKVADPLAKHLPDLPHDNKAVTLHHLLTHTAGFVDSLGGDDDEIGREAFVTLALASKLKSKPGEKHSYSNVGYSLLGAVVERTAKATCDEYLAKAVFGPAGMTRTGYRLPKWAKGEVAHGYRDGKDWGTPLDRPWAADGPHWHLRANGGVLSTAADLYRWAVAVRTDAVLGNEQREKAFAPHAKDGGGHYGYGWSVGKSRDGRAYYSHNGSNGVFFADLRIYPDDDAVLILATTASGLKYYGELTAAAGLVFPAEK